MVVEDGSGLSTADSYTTEAFADAYHLARNNEDWEGATTEEKEVALVKATSYIETRFPWSAGYKVTKDQALGWPRASATDKDGFGIDSDEIPVAVQQATADLALRALTTDLLPDEGRVTSSVKVGALEVEYADGEQETRYVNAEGILRGLIYAGGGPVEVIRA